MKSRSSNRTLSLALAVGAAWFQAIGESRADCQPQDLNVVLNTGWDESTGTVIPAGGTDDDWVVTYDASGGTVPSDADVVSPHPAWLTMPNSQWITANMLGPNGTYVYKTCWCLDDDFASPNLSFAIRADDDATVLANGTIVLNLPDGTFNDASPLGITVNPALLHPGENCLEVVVENKHGGPTGFNLTGWMTAVGGQCCGCQETDIHDDASTGVDDFTGMLIATGSDDDEWIVTAEPPPTGVLPRPAGVINTYIGWNVIPGTKWISANVTGPNGLYSYEKCWCMNPLFQNAELNMQLLADDRANVFLNGALIGSTPPSNAFLFPATSISTSNQSLFKPGENCVRIDVQNVSSIVTGLNVDMTVTATNAECCPCTELPPDAEGWWPLDETVGPTAADLLNDHDGAWLELIPTGPSPHAQLGELVNNSLTLDGLDDYVEVPDHPGLDFGSPPGQNFSFDAWIKSDTPIRKAIIHKKVPGLPAAKGYSFYASNFLHLELGDGAGFLVCSGDIPIADDQWHFVAATVDRQAPGGITLFVDGVIDQVCNPTLTGSLDNAQPLHFGAAPLNPASSRMWWKGQLDEIEIFRRALTPGEVSALHDALNSGKCPPELCRDSTGIPMCAGDCPTGLTCVAGAPPTSSCQCVQEAATCGGSAPACNGACPDPDDVCVPNGPSCFCVSPTQCNAPGDFPACDNSCPAGFLCEVVGNACGCVEEIIPCGDTFYPECGGVCPQGEICKNVVGTNACECRPEPVACGASPYPACDGACPANQECKLTVNQGCGCFACGTAVPYDPSGPIVIHLRPHDEVRWTPVTCALVYNLYLGTGPGLIDQNRDGLADDYGSCHIGDIIDTKVVDPGSPQPGAIHWYLVTAENFAGEGSLGENSSGQPRHASSVCP